ncbi:helix-turn-helix domain-containing protein [Candidatus Micrarchaeota archaeon]|nr:helix-turn-helix domain-containing protein [Candidatus Micrarchaeota archaeon]
MVDLDAAAQVLRYSGGLGDKQEAAFAVAPRRRRGRPKSGFSEQRLTEVMRLYFVEKLSMRQVADLVGVSHMSVYRMLSDPNVELLI